jgi:uncharacterized protein YwqG
MHRLLGIPDERTGLMPGLCDPDVRADEAFDRWRLLMQISRDDEIPWTTGWKDSRLYFWIERDALVRGDFSGVKAFRS